MNETHHEAWRRRNGLLPLTPQKPHPKLNGFASNRTIIQKPETVTAWKERWEREWPNRWELRGSKYYPRCNHTNGCEPAAAPSEAEKLSGGRCLKCGRPTGRHDDVSACGECW